MQIAVNEEVHLSEFRKADKPALVEQLRERAIYENTLRIPYPYTGADATHWLNLVRSRAADAPTVTLAIRAANGRLMGACGLEIALPEAPHRAEIGYWLGKPYWGHGIATAVVKALTRFAADDLRLVKLTAHVFAPNVASARVLEKNGFVQEGLLKKHHFKDGQLIDSRVFGRVLE